MGMIYLQKRRDQERLIHHFYLAGQTNQEPLQNYHVGDEILFTQIVEPETANRLLRFVDSGYSLTPDPSPFNKSPKYKIIIPLKIIKREHALIPYDNAEAELIEILHGIYAVALTDRGEDVLNWLLKNEIPDWID